MARTSPSPSRTSKTSPGLNPRHATVDRTRTARLGRELLARGLYINLAAKGYMSLAHTDRDLDETLHIFDESLAAVG